MINEINSNKTPLKTEKSSSAPKAQVTQLTKPSAPAPAAVTRSAASLASGAGLPADKLSASIVSFARFFSLSLKPNMLAAIRQQAFSQVLPQNAGSAASSGSASAAASPALTAASDFKSLSETLKAREALSLAAAAAESKGAELSPKGLETYAEAIDPEWQKQHEQDRQRDRRKRNQNEQAEKDSLKTESITADRLKKMSLEYMKENPLLEILNKLPGKNGQRWIILPFDFFENEKCFQVTIRVLLDGRNVTGCAGNFAERSAVRMAIEAAVYKEQLTENKERLTDGGDFEKKWLFVLDSKDGKIGKVAAYFQNKMTDKEQNRFKKELAEALEIPVKSIYVKYSAENFPCEAGCDDHIPMIDEAV